MSESVVYVLLATYNGEAYIRQMLESVLKQDYPCIHIIVSDDGSNDGTESILEEYATANPEKITHYKSGMRFGCAQKHFMHLLSKFQDAPYIMFCDQDDVWHPDKVRKTLEKMKSIEANSSIPSMVHTDLRVVDGDLAEISPSFCKHSKLDGTRLALNQLLVQNVVTGCTMMINNSLAKIACENYSEDGMMMHDWWLALLASSCGKTGFLDEATIDYRQHGNNSVGAKNVYSLKYLIRRLQSKRMRDSLKDSAYQAECFLSCYDALLDANSKELLSAFAKTASLGCLERNEVYFRYHLFKYGIVRKFGQILGI